MKKVVSILAMVLCTLAISAQKDVTTFLGIPVDGLRADMREKLISKGFTPKKHDGTEYFEGEFNGADVQVFIATNNNKVWRIMVSDAIPSDEANIKNRFNRLVDQFENNKRYVSIDHFTIPEDEDIGYNMTVHKKTYEAAFLQKPAGFALDEPLFLTEENKIKYAEELEPASKKIVWFSISKNLGRFYINMFYDNQYNRANGEDL